MIDPLNGKSCSAEFRRLAVDLYEPTPGATLKRIADDLGICRGTLTSWVRRFGSGAKARPVPSRTPVKAVRGHEKVPSSGQVNVFAGGR